MKTSSLRRSRIAAAPLLATALLALSAAAAPANPTTHVEYQLENVYTGMVADMLDWSTAPGAHVGQWGWNGGANQRWELTEPSVDSEGTTRYLIKNRYSGLCLEASTQMMVRGADGFWVDDGRSSVTQRQCERSEGQSWRFAKTSTGSFTIRNQKTDTFLHTEDTVAGSTLTADDEFGVVNRFWRLNATKKLPYSDETAGKSVPFAWWEYESGYCREGWHIELDPGTWSPRYNFIGDAGVDVSGKIFFQGDTNRFAQMMYVNSSTNDPRRIELTYYQNDGRDSSRNYALTGRVRFYCQPGSTF